MLDQSLVQKQKQSLTTQQIQQFLLLEIPCVELADRIQEELATNPALEVDPHSPELSSEQEGAEIGAEQVEYTAPEEELYTSSTENNDFSTDDYASEDDIPEYKLRLIQEVEEQREEIPFAGDTNTLSDYLREQFITLPLTPEERTVAEYIVGNLTDDGYFKLNFRDIEDDLLFNENITVSHETIEQVLHKIQSLEPAGVAAKDLQECLSLQLLRLKEQYKEEEEQLHRISLATEIVEHHFETLANRRYKSIMQALSLSEDEFASVQHLIRSLTPRPANGFGSAVEAAAARITPDFTVHLRDEKLLLWLNDPPGIPSLRISPEYRVLSERPSAQKIKEERPEEKAARDFARQRVQEASWFIGAITRRRSTLLSVMQIIVELQEPFFRLGDVALLRPMGLKDVAERAGYDISTVSRITSRKYVQSDYGIYSLKYFFSEGTVREEGDAVSTRQTKALIQSLIEQEDKRRPLSDAQIETMLAERGLTVARRTVAKYREQLNIPIARLRREL
ncbi:RNA polymerase factor sigma-54 [Porphyromonas circumdentaria]|uniref:RNA polymerase, sigma 54 subunit, RpoN/SigL n=1 Tax=Porphyromonas circumdentaria TaxID=29524 RepID=A0A1T4PMN7_9PORP|nr:RNA polymerase factor sigma-54 [Porphyromonas circumdentaria]MBB6276469.1 RNA polymerase sigma-54 factor [Porphyromonas circumdentaria]MDO4722483.1 RNA polymerase factor sigma-54 [Porphyromonas circumdentaria]SJZ92749.1 RNA polymerase, sigma 54 subunit, RpoN/SigL [Porphyromonas circumdentaria]